MIEQKVLLTNPFPGLRPFKEEESELFFGRDGQSDEVLTKLRRSRFVAVVGTSGSGKSSLVRAGVLPALRSGHMTSAGSRWRVAVFRPGNDPIGNLAEVLSHPDVLGGKRNNDVRHEIEATLRSSSLGLVKAIAQALLGPHENLLLVADQFEELFRFRRNIKAERPEDEAAAFVKLLLEARHAARDGDLPVYLVLTMRSDYLGEAAQFRGLPEAINEGQYLIPRMNDDEWREAITGPVWMCGAAITPQLVNRLLNDAGDRGLLKSAGENADRLPILQHVLMRAWEYWRDHYKGDEPISIPHYMRVGGLARALSLHADEAYFELSERQQRVSEKLFKRLTEKSADGREGRRPATVKEICEATEASEEEVKAVIESFRREGRSFLMPPLPAPLAPDTLVDISHESLIWGWERLRNWVDEEAQSARIFQRLADTTKLHAEGKEGYLRNPALQIALDWRALHKPNRAWAERYCPVFYESIAFLEASQKNLEDEEIEKARQRERELKQAQALADERHRRVKLQRYAIILLSLLLLGLVGLTAYAFQQKAEAQRQRRLAEEQKGEALKQRDIANQALLRAQQAEGTALKERDSAYAAKRDADIQRNVAQAALRSAQIAKVEADTQRNIAEIQKQEADRQKEEAVKAKQKTDETLRLVDEIDRSAPFFKAIWRDLTAPVINTSFSPDGKKVMTGGADGVVKLMEIKNTPGIAIPEISAERTNLAFSHDGTRYIREVKYRGHGVIFPPGRVVGVYDISDAPRALGAMDIQGTSLIYAAFSPDDSLIVIVRSNGIAHVQDAQMNNKFNISHKGSINYAAFSPDSKFIVTASDDGTAQIWNTETKQQSVTLVGHLSKINRATFSHSGKFIVTASVDGTIRVWNARTGEKLQELSMPSARNKDFAINPEANNAIFSYDDKWIAAAGKSGAVMMWGAEDAGKWTELSKWTELGTTARLLSEHRDEATELLFSHDNKWLFSASRDRTVCVWAVQPSLKDAAYGRPITILRGHIRPVTSLDFNNENRYLVTGSEDRTVRVWDLSRLGGLEIKAQLSAVPSSFEGDCPVTINFAGSITLEGGGGTVKYQFVRSDGITMLPQTLTFDAPGTKEVSTTWQLDRNLAAWMAIRVLEPQTVESDRATLKVQCRNYAAQGSLTSRITDDQLRQIMPASIAEKRALYLPYLQQAMDEFGINNPARQAAFLAQVARETVELRVLEEVWLPTKEQQRREPPSATATGFGNTEPGDGERFKIRGGFGITGRANYQKYGKPLGIDLVGNPSRAADPDVAFRIAGLYWQQYGLNEAADQQDFVTITRRVNGSLFDLQSRQKYYEKAAQVLGVREIERNQKQ